MAEKKYYWLKLKRDFFKRHDIRIIEEMPNGKEYILFYLKLLLESIDHEGELRFSETIPYNEQMLSVITNTNIDIVRSAMKMFIELNMMSVYDDQTIYMAEVDKLIGSETKGAERVRKHRQKTKLLQCNTDVTKCNTEIELEKEKEKELELEVDVESDCDCDKNKLFKMDGLLGKGVVYITEEQMDDLLDKLGFDAFNRYVERLADYIIEKNAHIKSHYETILKWHKEDTALGGK